MRPIEKKELKELIMEAKKAGKDTSELEKILRAETTLVKPVMGETKVEDIEKDVWMQSARGAEKVKKKGKRVIISTGPVNEDDFR